MSNRPCILLIDDDTALQHIVEAALQGTEIDIIYAQDAKTGLELLQKENPKLVMIDLLLPNGVKGWDLVQDIKTHHISNAALIAMTASGSDAIQRALEAGADGYLSKPFKIKQLVQLVDQHLEHAG